MARNDIKNGLNGAPDDPSLYDESLKDAQRSEPELELADDDGLYAELKEFADANRDRSDDPDREKLKEDISAEVELDGGLTGEQFAVLEDEQRGQRLERQRAVEAHEMAEMDERHRTLQKKLDDFLAAERERSANIRRIENRKKNTMDYAVSIYGKQADLEAIEESAQNAKEAASPSVRSLTDEMSVSIDNAIHGRNDVTVSVSVKGGGVRTFSMDKDIAEALKLYEERSAPDAAEEYGEDEAAEQARLELNEIETAKIKEIRETMADNQRREYQFEQKAPEAVQEDQYESISARRFKQYGYPDGVPMAYLEDKEHNMEWNGRPLPSAMSSPSMQQKEREDEYAVGS